MGVPIECVEEARNLGVVMDSKLRFQKFVTESVKNCLYRLKVLYRIRDFITVDLRVRLCESLVLSKLNYCLTVYGPCLLAKSQKLIQRVQNACARYCFKIPPRHHVTPYLKAKGMMKMCDRQKLYLATLLFGVIKYKTPEYLYEKLSWRSARNNPCIRTCVPPLNTPHHKTARFRGSFRYSATKCWNDIPPPLRKTTSIYKFKREYKMYLLKYN